MAHSLYGYGDASAEKAAAGEPNGLSPGSTV